MNSSLARNLESTTITAPFETFCADFLAWCVELAQESCSNLYVLQGEDGSVVVSLEAGTHGHVDALIECGEYVAYSDEIEMLAIKAFVELETSGSHTVRWTSRGVRAYLDTDWTRRYSGRTNGAEPAEFDSEAHRPWYLQPIPDAPKSKKTSGGESAHGRASITPCNPAPVPRCPPPTHGATTTGAIGC